MSEASPELSNQRAPRAVAARRLASRSYRSKQRLFLAEGPQAVREAADRDGVLVETARAHVPAVADANDAA